MDHDEPTMPVDIADPKVQKRLRTKYNLIRELVKTEETFSADIAVAIDIYSQSLLRDPYSGFVSSRDVQALFSNLDQVLLLSKRFVAHLHECVPAYILSDCDITPPESEENNQNILEDIQSYIGQVVLEYTPSMELTYAVYCAQSQFQLSTFYRIDSQGSPSIDRWLLECREASKSRTQAWTLDALLIKPVQRLMKYPLLLNSMLSVTDPLHPDYQLLKISLDRMQETTNRINSIEPETFSVELFAPSPTTSSPTPLKNGETVQPGVRTSTILDYNTAMSRLKDDPKADVELELLQIQFDRKQRHIKNLIKYLRGSILQIQNHFDTSSAFAHAWVNWSSATDNAYNLPYNKKNKVYRRFAMFSLPFTTSSSAHVSTNKLCRRVEDEVIEPLNATWMCYSNTVAAFELRERCHGSYNKYLVSKAASVACGQTLQLDPVVEASADNFVMMHNKLKSELPELFSMTEEMIDSCMVRFLSIQRDWFRVAVDSTSNVFSLTLGDIRLTDHDPIVATFHKNQVKDARQTIDEELGICHFHRNISAISTNGSGTSAETHQHSSTSSLSSSGSNPFDGPTHSYNAYSSSWNTERSKYIDEARQEHHTWTSQTTAESALSSNIPYTQPTTVSASDAAINYKDDSNASAIPTTPTTPVYVAPSSDQLVGSTTLTKSSSHEQPQMPTSKTTRKVRRRSSLLTLTGWQKSRRGLKASTSNNRLSFMNEI